MSNIPINIIALNLTESVCTQCHKVLHSKKCVTCQNVVCSECHGEHLKHHIGEVVKLCDERENDLQVRKFDVEFEDNYIQLLLGSIDGLQVTELEMNEGIATLLSLFRRQMDTLRYHNQLRLTELHGEPQSVASSQSSFVDSRATKACFAATTSTKTISDAMDAIKCEEKSLQEINTMVLQIHKIIDEYNSKYEKHLHPTHSLLQRRYPESETTTAARCSIWRVLLHNNYESST